MTCNAQTPALQDLDCFLRNAQQRLDRLQTSTMAVTGQTIPHEMLRCPFDPGHRMPHRSFIAHCKRCERTRNRGNGWAGPDSPSSMFFHKKAPGVVTILQRENGLYTAEGGTCVEALLRDARNANVEMPWTRQSTVIGAQKGVETQISVTSMVDTSSWRLLPDALPWALVCGWFYNFLPQSEPTHVPRHTPEAGDMVVDLAQRLTQIVCTEGSTCERLAACIEPVLGANVAPMIALAFFRFARRLLEKADSAHHAATERPVTYAAANAMLVEHDGDNIVCTVDYAHLTAPTVAGPAGSMTSGLVARRDADYLTLVDITDRLRQESYASKMALCGDDVAALEAARQRQQADQGLRDKSALELMVEQRDYKRRRRSYRAKNVRITKRTQTQIHHDLIAAYMDELRQPASVC
ncbi:hypothetical protein THASP1DRAFT_30662 [Thamnocephalis sphaerospora]|uniref:CHHC U11-48K-type domain-containing protein n=1 Tax=Thamnocephalis sphaerospora TaxID=78915 RepID=A0A4P9XNI7_9FUNG|nr:hypothetical protein THASP1DRAFT_30662 [Thamnocephalis sphaerospora]|eukprot:RKP07518.1 hypothetical protein THASP1DRAFT_30662 [Thamnocephalis sphaerospora]